MPWRPVGVVGAHQAVVVPAHHLGKGLGIALADGGDDVAVDSNAGRDEWLMTVDECSPGQARHEQHDDRPHRFGVVTGDAVDLIPLGRGAEVSEIRAAVAFLARDDSRFVTGQVISVNGGSSMG